MKLNLDKSKRYLLAVSGGVDSMVLLDLFIKSGVYFEVCNVDHGTLKEREKIKLALGKLSSEFGFKLHLRHIKESPIGNLENFFREKRYSFLTEICKQEDLVLVTAHHLNDVLETFLMRVSQGSSLSGLINMFKGSFVCRPLLEFQKNEILDYAKQNNLNFFEDPSNSSNRFLRNSVRNLLVPLVLKIFPNFMNGFLRSVKNLSSANIYLQNNLNAAIKEVVIKNEFGLKVEKSLFLKLTKFERCEFLINFFGNLSALKLVKLIDLIEGESSKQFCDSNKYLYVAKDHFLISEFSILQIENVLLKKYGVLRGKNLKKKYQRHNVPFYLRGVDSNLESFNLKI